MSPIVINVPTRGLLAVETMHAIVQWLANLNIKRNMTSMFVNKKHRYTDISSCVLNNGYASKHFHLERGVRQGCPLSGTLFIIAIE